MLTHSLLCHLNLVLYPVSNDDCRDAKQQEAGNVDKREVLMIISCYIHYIACMDLCRNPLVYGPLSILFHHLQCMKHIVNFLCIICQAFLKIFTMAFTTSLNLDSFSYSLCPVILHLFYMQNTCSLT